MCLVVIDARIHSTQQSTIHVTTFDNVKRSLPTSLTHLSICTTNKLSLNSMVICDKIKLHPLYTSIDPYYTSILSSNHQHTKVPAIELELLLSLGNSKQQKTCPYHSVSIWIYTKRNTIDYLRRCSLLQSDHSEPLEPLGTLEPLEPLEPPEPLETTNTNININLFPLHILRQTLTTIPSIKTNKTNHPPPKFGVQHIQSKPVRDIWMTFIETNMKIKTMADAGVQTKELYAMVVDKIGNLMPEILTQLISSLIKIPLVTLIGQLLSALLPDALMPNSGATPNVPIVPGIEPIKPDPPPKCSCSGGASFSLLERWRKKKGIASDGSAFVDEGTTQRDEKCPCEKNDRNDQDDKNNNQKENVKDTNFIEDKVTETEKEKEKEKELKAEENLRILDETYAPGAGGGSNGGPIAKIEPKLRDNVVDGLLSMCMPSLQEDLAAKIIKLWPTVKYSVERGAVRGLSQSLTKSITNALVEELLKKLFMGLTKHTTRELTTRLTIGLTHSLSSTISHALSRSPKDDYYCHYCEQHQLYCDLCVKATTREYKLDYHISYYSTYWSTYYSRFYGTTISDYISKKGGAVGHDAL